MAEPSAELIQFEIELHDKKLEDMTTEMKTLRTKVHDINNSLTRTQGFLAILEKKIDDLSGKLDKMAEVAQTATVIFKGLKFIIVPVLLILFIIDWSRVYYLGANLLHSLFKVI